MRIFWNVMLLLVTTVSLCGAQTPKGQLIEQADGSYDYIVDKDDRVGQWGIAFGDPTLWQELKNINPQLKDPDLIRPGDRLNVPTPMLRLFQFMVGSHNLATATTIHDTVFVPSTTKSEDSGMPNWLKVLIVVGIAVVLYRLGSTRTRTEIESRRKIEDPYSGPDRVEGGLPTAEAALNYFAHVYENERLSMSVAEAAHYPALVRIIRIVPVDVRGPMWITYGNSDDPIEKDLPDWAPAWQCWLDDDTYRIALMRCGNDVRSGGGMIPFSEDQIRPRQDMKVVEVNHQVWPVVTEEASEDPLERVKLSADAKPYREVRVKSATRYVLLPHEGPEKTIDVSDLPGGLARLAIVDGKIVIEAGEKTEVIGELCEKDPLKEETDAENLSLINVGPPTTASRHDNAGLVD